MNLAICSNGELFGGVERQIIGLCEYLMGRGTPPVLVVLFHDAELARQLREIGVEPKIISGRNKYDLKMVDQIVQLFKTYDISVVHVHGYKATIGCGLAKRKLNFRIVKTEHGKVEGSLKQPISWLKTRINFFLEQLITRNKVDAIRYVTNDISSSYDQLHRSKNRKTIYNGIAPLDRANYPCPEDLDPKNFNIGIVGRISGVKGIEFALEAFTNQQVPQNVHLSIIGTGPLEKHLRAKASQLDLNHCVHFLGFRSNIYDYLANIDALLMPSFHEGLPYTLLEAMSLRTPVLTSNVGGLAETLEHEDTGLLFEVADISGMVYIINLIATDSELAQQLADSAQKTQNSAYSLNTMGQAYFETYQSLV